MGHDREEPAGNGDNGPTLEDGVARLYRHTCYDCGSRWSRFSGVSAEERAMSSGLADVPILDRVVWNRSSDEWVTKNFTIQDPTMREFLQELLDGYQDLDLEHEEWTFTPPYSALVHRWNELSAASQDNEKPEPVKQLMRFLSPLVQKSVEAIAKRRETGTVDYDSLWQIFPPGEYALTTLYGYETVCRITKHKYRRDHAAIGLEYLDWNGESSGYVNTERFIFDFEGVRRVNTLAVYPISFHPNAAEVRSRIIERGRKFEQLRGYNFQNCVGTKILLSTEKPERRAVNGRVVIDSFAYFWSNYLTKDALKPLEDAEGVNHNGPKRKGTKKKKSRSRSRSRSSSGSEGWVDGDLDDGDVKVVDDHTAGASRIEYKTALTDEQCLIATPWVRGLDLQQKEWALFNVDEISPVKWNDAAFDHLVLPGDEKHLAWDFVENQGLAKTKFDDFVPDKGRGLIILMYGPPGVGKTFTAEAVAERARVPLYPISAGTLGTDPSGVEAALTEALDLCAMWGAMLLLDEADVFLTSRTNEDLLRNELVAIFLTKLEYYAGICFLTTNRIKSLDHAFQSRVDLFLPYADLTVPARHRVWSHFINRAGRGKFTLSDADLDTLAEVKLNGREIKNLVKSAHLLSLKDDSKITMERVHRLAQNRIRALKIMEE